ncbi:hypothetical protein BGZ74_002458 [Mortierella antarctica]|nr:hypothetical protein BGZ74_002458 [Mortierella antarctica]
MATQSQGTARPKASSQVAQPQVIIVGAGFGGLLLGILLEMANIEYQIFERGEEIRPIGTVITLGASVLGIMEQIGIYDELMKVSLPCLTMSLYDEKLEQIIKVGPSDYKGLLGYDVIVFPRPALYELLLAKIPKHKISFKKKVLSVQETGTGVVVNCADSSSYEGDIVVGADGAYSAVRQSLYKQLEKQNKLPASDAAQMNVNFMTMIGTTDPLDSSKHPGIGGDATACSMMFAKDSPLTWSTFTIHSNRVCWSVKKQLDTRAADEESFRSSEWGPEVNEALIREVSTFKTIHGDLGSLILQTPKDKISRVFLEDKMFETWYHRRVVLIGDACHKLLPSSGQGAINAFQDAAILSNCFYDMTSTDLASITAAFKDYREQRYDHVKGQYDRSKVNAKIMYGQTWSDKLLRKVIFTFLPRSLMEKGLVKEGAYRPQVTFLPHIPNRGRGHVLPQKPSRRYTEEQRAVAA